MNEHRKTVKVPDDYVAKGDSEPLIAVVVHDQIGGRDVTKPVGYDKDGKPLYAPPGRRVRVK